MNNETIDIDALQKILNTVAEVTAVTVDNLEDGKISKLELIGYVDDIVPLISAFMGTKEAIQEIKDGISSEERQVLLNGIREHFDLQDDVLEEKVEALLQACLSTIEDMFDLVDAVKDLRK